MATASSIAAQIVLKNAFFRGFLVKNVDFPERQKRVAPENPLFFVINTFFLVEQYQSLSPSIGHRNSTYSTSPQKGTHFLRNELLSEEMLNFLNFLGHVESKCA